MNSLKFIFCSTVLSVSLFAQEQTHEIISWEKHHLNSDFTSEGACFGDINKDGTVDVVSGPFVWLGPKFKTKIEIYEAKPFNPNGYSDNFFSYTHDFNKDGWLDVLVLGFPGKDSRWYENPKGAEGHWPSHLALAVTDNESPAFTDLTGDGNPEIVCSSGGVFGYASPNPDKPTEPFTWHPISNQGVAGGKFTHGLGVGDVNGDGRLDLLEKGRWWEQPESLNGDPVWKSHRTEFIGGGGAQMFAYDFDGDGDNDVLTSLQAHGYGLAWYEQLVVDGKKTLRQRLIMGKDPLENKYGVAFSQLHALDLADIDGDGLKDLITGKRYWAHRGRDPGANDPAVLYWFRTVRGKDGVDFIPYQIDDDSGVGTEVKTGDVNGDGLLDIIVGNKKGTFIHIQKRRKVDKQAWQDAQPMKAFIDGILPMNQYASGRTPEDAAAAMTLPSGFSATLIAAEPDLTQPITFCFDERGRIWVAEARTYPTPAEPGKGKDRILIFEDTDGDGTFETRKVFAEGLHLISGMELGFGGVWVGASPQFLFIPDRDKDDVPDGEPQVLLDGWGVRDTHETLNSFSWGPDGWLYGLHGVFNYSHVGKPGAPENERTYLDCGVWRYHPVRHEFEIFARGTSNPWGLDFDQYGEIFTSACVIPHLWHMVQGGYYERQGGQHKRKHLYELMGTIAKHRHFAGSVRDHAHWGENRNAKSDVVAGSTFAAGGGHAHCGLTIYQGDNFPERYRGALLMFNLHGHRMNWDRVRRSGSGYLGDRAPDFLFANDHWFVGTDLHYGPDGALYFTDWQDDTTCHRRDDLEWDRSNGRLFRVHHGEHKPVKIDLGKASNDELIEMAVFHQNEWFARTARRLLGERKVTIAPKASDALRENPNEAIRLRALWTLHQLGIPIGSELLSDSSELIRAWAIRLAFDDGDSEQNQEFRSVALAKGKLGSREPSPLVRRNLASLLQRIPADEAWPIAENLALHGEDAADNMIPLLIWYGLEPLVAENPARGLKLAKNTKIAKLRDFVLRRVAAIPGGYEMTLNGVKDSSTAELVVSALAAQLKNETRVSMPEAWPRVYDLVRKSSNPATRLNALFLAGKFGDQRLVPEFRTLLAKADAPVEMRLVALNSLVEAKDAKAVPLIHRLVQSSSGALRNRAIECLATVHDSETNQVLLTVYPTLDADAKRSALRALTSRKESAFDLLEAVGAGKIPRNDIGVLEARHILQFKDSSLTAALERHWGAVKPANPDKKAAIAEWTKRLSPEILAKANPGNGRRVFNQTCGVCHQLFGHGIAIGPDITGANRSDLGYLLENILDPNSVVSLDYQLTVFTKKDKSVVSGMIRNESASAFTVALPGGTETQVAKSEVVNRQTLPQSLMPEGILETLPDTDARDLIAYLKSEKQVRISQPGELLFEGEAMKIVRKTGKPRPQKMGSFKADKWSGDTHLWWINAKPGDSLVLEFSVPEDGNYSMSAAMTKAHDYGQVRLKLDEETNFILDQIDLYDRKQVVTTGEVSLGKHTLKAGKHRLIVDMLGRNPKATPRYMFGLDYLLLRKRDSQ